MSPASREQENNGFNVPWKLCLNLCSLRWLKPTRRRVNNFKPETSLVPKVLFAVGRIKSKSALRNTEYEGAWQIEVSSLFHSLIVWGKKRITKSFCYILFWNIYVYYNAYLVGKINCKDNLVFDYSKFYKYNKVFESTSSPSLSQIQVLGIVFP